MLKQLLKYFTPKPRVACYHCGDHVLHPVFAMFAGQSRQLCCQGCASVLQAIEQAGQSQSYLDHKASLAQQTSR